MARKHQESRKAPAQITDLYFQKWEKVSFKSQARAVASLLASRALSFCLARPRTRLPRRSKGQRMCLSRCAACLFLARSRALSARRT